MRDGLLWLHLVGVAAWLGGNLTQFMLMPRLERAGQQAAIAWHEGTGAMAKIYYSVAGTVVAVTGVLLVLRSDTYTFADAFVSVGFAVVIVGGIMGVAFFAPASRRAVEAHRSGDAGAVAAVGRRIRLGAVVDTSLILFAIWAMVAKLGA